MTTIRPFTNNLFYLLIFSKYFMFLQVIFIWNEHCFHLSFSPELRCLEVTYKKHKDPWDHWYLNQNKRFLCYSKGIDFFFEIAECVRKYVGRIWQNLESLSSYYPCPPTVFWLLRIMVKLVKSLNQISWHKRFNQ